MIENSTSTKEGPTEHGFDEEPDERSAGFVLYSMDGGVRKYLLLRHRYGGHWGFPKGHIEAGESEVEAALRETREETGIATVDLIPDFRKVSRYHFYRMKRPVFKETVYFLGRAACGKLTLSREHTQYQWLRFAEAGQRLTFDSARHILDQAEKTLSMRREAISRQQSVLSLKR